MQTTIVFASNLCISPALASHLTQSFQALLDLRSGSGPGYEKQATRPLKWSNTEAASMPPVSKTSIGSAGPSLMDSIENFLLITPIPPVFHPFLDCQGHLPLAAW